MIYDVKDSGKRLKELRKSKGLSQEQLCVDAGLTYGCYSKVERGTNGASIDTLMILSEFYGVSVDYLVFGNRSEFDIGKLLEGRTVQEIEFALALLDSAKANRNLLMQ